MKIAIVLGMPGEEKKVDKVVQVKDVHGDVGLAKTSLCGINCSVIGKFTF